MGTYLEDNPPKRRQFKKNRRAKVTGAIVVDTAENSPNTKGQDHGAVTVARFISLKTESGSYHSVVDSENVIRVVPYEWEALHDRTGGNRWSLSLAFAAKSEEWQVLPAQWLEDLILKGATEARSMADWVSSSTGVTIPSRRITAEEYRAGEPGFISHAELNSGHASGPGDHFPWEAFLNEFKQLGSDSEGQDIFETEEVAIPKGDISDSTATEPDTESRSKSHHAESLGVSPADSQAKQSAGLDGVGAFSMAMDDIDELYRAYKGNRPASTVRRSVAQKLAEHVFVEGRPIQEFVVGLQRKLASEDITPL